VWGNTPVVISSILISFSILTLPHVFVSNLICSYIQIASQVKNINNCSNKFKSIVACDDIIHCLF
jgi:hypothetical protein